MNIFGYIRVSTREQNEIRQLAALKSLGLNFKKYILIKTPEKILKDRSTKVCWLN